VEASEAVNNSASTAARLTTPSATASA
jgi:hypothetical protein